MSEWWLWGILTAGIGLVGFVLGAMVNGRAYDRGREDERALWLEVREHD
jgi:hypothetical protein